MKNLWADTEPQANVETGITVNPVHVVDLAVYLPAMIVTGVLVLRKKILGYRLLVPMIVSTFSMCVNITAIYMVSHVLGFEGQVETAGVFGAVATIQLLLVIMLLRVKITKGDIEILE